MANFVSNASHVYVCLTCELYVYAVAKKIRLNCGLPVATEYIDGSLSWMTSLLSFDLTIFQLFVDETTATLHNQNIVRGTQNPIDFVRCARIHLSPAFRKHKTTHFTKPLYWQRPVQPDNRPQFISRDSIKRYEYACAPKNDEQRQNCAAFSKQYVVRLNK